MPTQWRLLVLAIAWMVGVISVPPSGNGATTGGKKVVKAEEVFKSLDTDRDGKISQDEFLAGKTNVTRAKTQFTQSDKNCDRFLNLAELKAWLKRMTDRAAKKDK